MSPNAPPLHFKDHNKGKKFIKDNRLSRGYKNVGFFSTVNKPLKEGQMTKE
jgi:hypothetical protein